MLAKINLRCEGSALPLFLFDADEGAGGGDNPPAPESEAPGSPASGPDNGTPGAENNAPDDDKVDYESRYNDLRPEFDRRGTELDQLRQFQQAVSGAAGPEAQAQAFAAIGLELDEGDNGDPDLNDDPDARMDQFEERLNEREAAEQQSQYEAAESQYLAEGIEILEEQAKREFSDEEIQALAAIARANPNDQGIPDLAFAHQQLEAYGNSLKKQWMESKQTGRQPGSGVPAIEQVDLDNDEARVDYMAKRLAEGRTSSQ